MSCADFWSLTPRETLDWVKAAAFRERETAKRVVTGAWFGEVYARRKQLDSLKETLRDSFEMTPEERKAAAEEKADAFFDYLRRQPGVTVTETVHG